MAQAGIGIFLRAVAVPFFRFVAPTIGLGIAWGYRQTLYPVLQRLWPFLARTSPVALLGQRLLQIVAHRAEKDTAAYGIAQQALGVGFFHSMAHLTRAAGYTIANTAVATLHGFEDVVGIRIPRTVRVETKPIRRAAVGAAAGVRLGQRELAREQARIAKWLRTVGASAAAALALAELIARNTIALDLPHAIPGIRTQTREWVGYTKRNLRAHLRLIAAALGAALLAKTIARVIEAEIPWRKCKNVDRVARHLCRFPVKLLEELLAGIVDVLIIRDLCLIVNLMTTGAKAAAPVIEEIVALTDGLIQCQGAERPHDLPVTVYAGPPDTASLPLAT